MPPWKYLGLQIAAKTIVPQKMEIECNPKTLADLHSLCGSLNWEGRNSPKRLTKEMFEHLLQSNASLQLSLDSYRGQISVHAPSHKLLNEEFHLIPREKRSRRPLKALTVFTDASGASHKSVMTWRNPQTQRWEADVEFVEGSPQVAELAAVVRAFEKFSEPINLVTDSAYVAGVVSRAEQAVLKEIDNEHLFRLLSKLIYLISHREHPFYVMHVRSHTDLPGEVAEGNRQADSLAAPVKNARLPDIFQQAKLSHQQYHQNVPGLIHQFQLTRSQAGAIVATCPSCQVQAMPSMEKAYLTLNPVMNPIQVVILLLLNSLAAAWFIPQLHQNVWVTLAQTLLQENICLSTASTENPMSTCLDSRNNQNLDTKVSKVIEFAKCPESRLECLANPYVGSQVRTCFCDIEWPLPDNKLSALKDLVAEQLQKGHIKPTNSPWNSPVFVIHKKTSNTWRLLQDLRKINAVIENMGPLQPGLPNLSMIPRDWPLVIIDLKDCFFNIPLHPDDAPRFAFSVPSTNLQEPLQRYHWLVLPQGMINSPTICQYFVARALSPVREQFPQSVILHYMDDLLIAAPTRKQMEMTRNCVVAEIKKSGLIISESKIQETAPWKYLGWKLTEQSITPQKIQIRTDVHTLQDLQQLLGEINWVRPVLGITADELAPLFDLLKGDNDIRSPRSLTPEAHKALEEITNALQSRQAHRCVPDKPFFLAILGEKLRLCGLIFQWDSYHKDPLLIIEWVFISYRSPKTILTPLEMMSQIIIKGRARLLSIAGREFAIIYLPMKKTYFDWAMQKSEDLLYALLDFPGTCSIHYPAHKMIKAKLCYKEKPLISEEPLDAVTIFTDGSGRTHNSVITWQNKNTKTWEQDVQKVEGSPQIVELAAVVRAFQLFPEPFNLITDSAYVANVIKRIEGSVLKDVNNDKLCLWLTCLCQILSHRTNPYFISHIRAHSGLPGFMAEGNARADALASAAFDEEGAASIENSTSVLAATTLPNTVEQAKLSHAFFHQNAQAIKRDFHISLEQAQNIVRACPNCQQVQPLPSSGATNPRGLESLQKWQTDVTKYPSFGKLKNIHVSVDTFSNAVFASVHAGETAKHVCQHFSQAFSYLGVPQEIKTDNGPSYTSQELAAFLNGWGVRHTFGIPYSPTSQGMIERTHQTLKRILDQQKGGEDQAAPQKRLNKALYVYNFLNSSAEEPDPPIYRHFLNNKKAKLKEHPPVLIKNLDSGQIEGPYNLITWGKGFACVSTEKGLQWIPAKNVKPYHASKPAETPTSASTAANQEASTQT
ncbi:hypothetical protein DUI87_19024 [Hirundo rustica rustica]|uniref:Uncharacterized protein n=1 Tax=Hirundo rustica rustica TaxID=333673 RepID=A0A3M0JU09_HIRRU|nr:hypothetical protein DUI87_19024 [Hirundo rustica rustica]